jgi:hypothetical protein
MEGNEAEEGYAMGVPAGVWVAAFVIVILLAWMTFWVTNKAYSRKWEDTEDPKL